MAKPLSTSLPDKQLCVEAAKQKSVSLKEVARTELNGVEEGEDRMTDEKRD